jgi:poly-gamma-glutamate synthesis protein (capsule biosynthesis protein)
MKNILSIFLAFCLIVVLAGCGSTSVLQPEAESVVTDLPTTKTDSTADMDLETDTHNPHDQEADVPPLADEISINITTFYGITLSAWEENTLVVQVEEAYSHILGDTVILVYHGAYRPPIQSQMAITVHIDAIYDTVPRTVYTSNFAVRDIPVQPPPFNIALTFTGDSMLASYKNRTTANNFNAFAEKYPATYFYEKVQHIFATDDFTIVNLENVFTDKSLEEVVKNHSPAYWYRSKTANVNILTSSSVEGVSLANNHIGDYGKEGKQDTIDTIRNAGLFYGTADEIMYFEKNGFVVAVICRGLWSEGQAKSIIKMIDEAETKSHFQIVYYHGGTERLHAPEKWKQRASRALVDAGADLVIGNHPHVLQPREIYHGVEIVYSLGNFCFGGNSKPENRTIIYQYTLSIEQGSNIILNQQSNIIPCYVYTGTRNNYQPAPITDPTQQQYVLDFMDGQRQAPY